MKYIVYFQCILSTHVKLYHAKWKENLHDLTPCMGVDTALFSSLGYKSKQ